MSSAPRAADIDARWTRVISLLLAAAEADDQHIDDEAAAAADLERPARA